MAILQAVLALLFRSAGRLLNTAFGWATTMLFGKVPQDRQIYLSVVADVEQALDRGGFEVERQQASWMLRLPTKVLTTLAGGAIDDLVADQLTVLRSDRLEVLLHPSDLVVNGAERDAARANAIIAEQLAFTPAYMTWSKEANEIEDRLRKIWITLRQQAERPGMHNRLAERLAAVEHDLRTLELSYEEWEVLFREKLMVERALLQVKADLVDRPLDLTEAPPERLGATPSGRALTTTASRPGGRRSSRAARPGARLPPVSRQNANRARA